MQRNLYPTLPTQEEVTKNPGIFYSSYLPVFVRISLDGNSENDLRILSYRVLDVNELNNVSTNKESDRNADARYLRIAYGLKNCAAEATTLPDVILLQDVNRDLMLKRLRYTLNFNDTWEVDKNDWGTEKNKLHQLTIYNKKRLSLLGESFFDEEGRVLSSRFSINTNIEVLVHNVWSDYSVTIEKLENEYRDLLNATRSRCIVFGHTGFNISPVGLFEPVNLTTGIKPPIPGVAVKTAQLPSYSSGAFYKNENGKISQRVLEVIDIRNGCKVTDLRKIRDMRAVLSSEQLEAYDKPHPTPALDDYYQTYFLIQGKSLFGCQDDLQDLLGDNSIVVRVAANGFNEGNGFSVRVKKPENGFDLKNYLFDMMPEDSLSLALLDTGKQTYIEYNIKKDHMNDFINAVFFLCRAKENFAVIDDKDLESKAKQAIKNATRDYVEFNSNRGIHREKDIVDKIWSVGAAFNSLVFRPKTRAESIEERINKASSSSEIQMSYYTLQNLLWDAEHNNSLKAFKYFAASYLMATKANTDLEARALIKLAPDQLAGRINAMDVEWENSLKIREDEARSMKKGKA